MILCLIFYRANFYDILLGSGEKYLWTEQKPILLFIDEIQLTYGEEFAKTFWDIMKRMQLMENCPVKVCNLLGFGMLCLLCNRQ